MLFILLGAAFLVALLTVALPKALASNPLYSQSTRGPLPTLLPQGRPDAVVTKTFAASAGATETLEIGTPIYVAAATGFAHKLVPGSGTAEQTEVFGFVYPAAVTIKATGDGEVLGTVMILGEATWADIRALQVAGKLAGTEAQLKTALRKSIVRERGLHINGLDLLGGP
jgi:hypothetical protein